MNKQTGAAKNNDFGSLMTRLQDFLELYLVKKAPAIPDNAKEIIVKYSPYISLIIAIFLLPTILLSLGLGALLAPFAFMGGYTYGASFSIGTLIALISIILECTAIPGLFSRKLSAWNFVFYASIATALGELLSFNIGNMIIGTAISWYFLFQVKSYYK